LRQDRSRGDPPTPNAAAHNPEEEHSSATVAQPKPEDPERSIRAKVSRVLKDLSLDTSAVNIAAVVGGKKNSDPQSSSGPVQKSKDERDQN